MTTSRNLNFRWAPGRVRRLARYLDIGLTYEECAKLIGVTRSAIISATHRYDLALSSEAAIERRERANYEREKGGRAPQWNAGRSDRSFIEPWAKFHARKKKEREEARASSPQVNRTP